MREIIRKRLIKYLSEARITIIEAPAGYGKSFLVKQYTDTLPEESVIRVTPLTWDRSEYPFPLKLVEKLKNRFNGERFVSICDLLERGDVSIELISHRFGREITEVEDELTIVIEDFRWSDATALSFLRHLLLYAPRNIRVILCCGRLTTGYIPDKVSKECRVISKTDMKFTESEAAQMFEGITNDQTIRAIWKASNGWVYGIAAIYGALKSGMEPDKIIMESGKPNYKEAIKYYGYDHYGSDTQDFLLRTSIIPFFDRPMVRTLFGWRGAAMIDGNLKDNIFIEEVESGIFRYQPLYRSMLRNTADRVFRQDDIYDFLSRSGVCLLDTGRYELGFDFLKHSRQWDAVSQAVKDNLIWLESPRSKRFRLIFGRELPDDISAKFPYLGNFKVYSYYFAGEYDKAVRLTNSLLASVNTDRIIESRLLYYALFHYHRAGEEQKAERINRRAVELINVIREGETESFTVEYGILPWLLTVTALYESFYGDPLLEERLLNEAMSELGETDSLLYYIIAANLLRDVSNVNKEKLTHIKSIYDRVPEEEADLKAFILARLIICYLQTGEIDIAKEYVPALYSLDRNVSLYQKIQKYQAVSSINLYEGNIEGYIQTIQNGIAVLIQAQNVVLENVWVAKLSLGYLSTGETERAIRNITNHFIPPIPDSPSVSLLLYTLAYIIVLGYSGDIERMEEYVTPLKNNDKWGNIIDRQYGSYWLLIEMIYSFLVGDIDELRANYRKLTAKDDLSLYLLPQLIDRAIIEVPGLATALDADSSPEILEYEPVYRIRLLGGFRFDSPNGELSTRSFKYRKSAELIALLAMRPGSALTVEDVVYQLYGELSPEKGRQRIRVILHHLRKSLGGIGVEDLVVRRDDSLLINRERNLEVDAIRFEELLSTAEALKARGDKDRAYRFLREALEIHTGDFLPTVYSDWSTRWYHYFELLYNRTLDWVLELSAELGYNEHLIEYAHRISMYENAHTDLREKAEALIS